MKMNARFIARVRVVALALSLVALVIIGRLYVLQIVDGRAYAARAEALFVEPQTPLTERNSIYFTDKNGAEILAATLKSGFTLAVNPQKVTDAAGLYAQLKPFLDQAQVTIAQSDFVSKATKPGSQYQVIADHLDSSLGSELEQQQFPGVVLADDRWRYYPGGSLASRVIGFVAYNGDEQEGRYGLERFYEDTLAHPADDLYANFFVELFGEAQTALEGGEQSGDVITTIEPSVQTELERDLNDYMAQWHPQLAGGIVMDPKTGTIYAMAVKPDFDLNNFGAQTDPLIYANPLIENVYEMGSIIKPLTMAAGIDSGAITPDETYNDTGCITVDTKQICNYDLKARGVIPMQQILSQSLNVGASFVATQMGSSTMRDYFLNHYDLGQKTGVDMPGEVAGLVSTLKSPRAVDYDTASFGQGMAVTPIETIRALATLANGGYLVTPHFASAIRYDTGLTTRLAWPASGPVLQPQTTTDVTRMLTTVVDTVLANGTVKLDHYSIAAKTGTGQIANPAGGGYYTDRYLHSYFGYLPSYDAKFIILLFAYEPVGAPYASETWSSYFSSLTKFLINYYNLPPDR
jgi:stage V sporulation protein D (sporulation-specific penicillin-binding protein)